MQMEAKISLWEKLKQKDLNNTNLNCDFTLNLYTHVYVCICDHMTV